MAPSSTCQSLFDTLSAYVDGELSPKDRVSFEQHLSACKGCTSRVADLRATSGLLRVGLEMTADAVDFSGFSAKVMARITPEKAPFWERLRLNLSERFTYQRGAFMGGFAALAVAAAAVVTVMTHPELTSRQPAQVAVDSVSTDETAHVAPVVMKTEQGTIIWLVDHADKNAIGAPVDAGQAPERPKGGDL